jgi:hypothetical protein
VAVGRARSAQGVFDKNPDPAGWAVAVGLCTESSSLNGRFLYDRGCDLLLW